MKWPSVILAFDTEDFVTPQSDDALAFLVSELNRCYIPGCFALVGDKARALVERGRRDIIEALADHEIDYHSNDHHFFPPLATTIEPMDWEQGAAWVLAHEARGVGDIENILGVAPVVWAKTDSQWTTQSLYAFEALGMTGYASRHFARDDLRPYWYMNMLSLPYAAMLDHLIVDEGTPRQLLKRAVAEFEPLAEKAGDDGVIVYGTHPCMWVCQTFYDLHNIKRRGQPPAKRKWRPAPLLDEQRIQRNREFFTMFLGFLRGRGCRTDTYGHVIGRRIDDRMPWLPQKQLATLARRVRRRLASTAVGGRSYSCAEILGALGWALARFEEGGLSGRIPIRSPLGPIETPRVMTEPLNVCSRAVVGAASKASAYIGEHGRLPSGIDVGGHHFPPAQLLRAAAEAYLSILDTGKACGATLTPGPDCPEDAELLEGASISSHALPKDYRPERLLEQGRLQSWTLRAG